MSQCPCDTPIAPEVAIANALNAIAAGQSALPRQVRSFPDGREALLATLPEKGGALRLARAQQRRPVQLRRMPWCWKLRWYWLRVDGAAFTREALRLFGSLSM